MAAIDLLIVDCMVNITVYNKHRFMVEMGQCHPQAPAGSKYFFFFLQDTICFVLQSFFYLLPQMMPIYNNFRKAGVSDPVNCQIQ